MPCPGPNKFIDTRPNIIARAMEMKKNKNVKNQIFDDCLCELRFAIPTDMEKNITGIRTIFSDEINISAISSAT
jgi:hypothetical protein